MVNRFDERYDIRLAQYAEIPELMAFIDTYWKQGHILATNRSFFEYEMVLNGVVNFVIAKDINTGIIDGIIGFLPCSNNKTKLDVWGVIWKTTPDAMPMLGMELIKRLPIIINARNVLGVGANEKTSVLLLSRIYHYYTAKMKHYYRLANRDKYSIAKVKNKVIKKYQIYEDLHASKLNNIDEFNDFLNTEILDVIPFKNAWYYNRRFYSHPLYKYEIWGLQDSNCKAIIIVRKQEYGFSRIIRIVDYVGDETLFKKCGSFFDSLLNDCEYIDFYFDGFSEEVVEKAGFVSIDEYPNIIPDYFNPFEQINVDIHVVSSNNNEKCMFFKADGDQDRPN